MEEVGEVLIQGLSISPGKPTIFATSRGKPIIGLPGNPVSAMIVLDKFTVPIIEKLQGAKTQLRRPLLEAELTKNMPSVKGRTEFVRVRIREEKEKEEEEEKEKEKEKIYADPIRASSSQIKSLSSADGLITIPAQSEGVAKGEKVMVEVW
jgi:molybdopterin molybdotransferase